jgi:SAM-dependent methyltransferase
MRWDLISMEPKQKEALVKELYEKYPYPSRLATSKRDIEYFAAWVARIFGEKKEFWRKKSVLELGCGTGELACALALSGAKVEAIDFSSSSIKKARELAKKFGVADEARFTEENILSYDSMEKFDVVIALGSLHHTIDAHKAFHIAAKHVKGNGLIVVGLYNKYSRFRHRVRRLVLFALAENDVEKRIAVGKKIFGFGSNPGAGGREANVAWLADKYGQVHESYHSVLEVKKWFKEGGFEFVASKPKFRTPIVDELGWLLKKKGAFFVMVGKKT